MTYYPYKSIIENKNQQPESDPWTKGCVAGMANVSYFTNPFNRKTKQIEWEQWQGDWSHGRVCLKINNPIGVPAEVVETPVEGLVIREYFPTEPMIDHIDKKEIN